MQHTDLLHWPLSSASTRWPRYPGTGGRPPRHLSARGLPCEPLCPGGPRRGWKSGARSRRSRHRSARGLPSDHSRRRLSKDRSRRCECTDR